MHPYGWKHLVSGLFLILFSPCATSESTKHDETRQHDSAQFTFVDARPEEQRWSSRTEYARAITSCFGDDALNPSGPSLLQKKLHEALEQKLFGKQIILNELVVEISEPSRVFFDKDGRGGSIGDVQTDMAMGIVSDTASLLGLTGIGAVKKVDVSLVVTISGRKFFSEVHERYRFGTKESAALEALTKAIDEVVASIRNEINK
ncbi:MAG: hypothetical protein HY083_05415 [Gammaproteobacteria bacterium]|nr:hypothetical protein [Gammaproteobacteria bacterium]